MNESVWRDKKVRNGHGKTTQGHRRIDTVKRIGRQEQCHAATIPSFPASKWLAGHPTLDTVFLGSRRCSPGANPALHDASIRFTPRHAAPHRTAPYRTGSPRSAPGAPRRTALLHIIPHRSTPNAPHQTSPSLSSLPLHVARSTSLARFAHSHRVDPPSYAAAP